jgi:MFS family permease
LARGKVEAASAPRIDAEGERPLPSQTVVGARPGARTWIALAFLCFVYVLNFLDRQLLSILAKPIQDSLHLSDSQLGLIGGLYFALFYCLISIPVGWLADRTHRVGVLSAACALWSAATMACGLSANYPQLVAARMTVGIGEAGGVPPSYAIISDYFPPGRRGTALGLYNLGPPIGQALGVALGASIAAAFGWRNAFISLGSVGVVTAAVVALVVREPARGGLDAKPMDLPGVRSGFAATVRMFFTHPALRLAALAGGATQIVTYGAGNFTTLFLMREKGMTLNEVAIYFALVVVVCMGGGIFVSGRVIDRFASRSKAAYAVIPAATLAAAVPFFLAFVWAPSWPLALLFLMGPTFLNYFYLSAAVTLVQEEVRPDQRVLSGALLLLVMNLIGLGLGPTLVGALSDLFRAAHPHHSLQLAFLCLTPFYGLAIGLFAMLAQVLRREDAKPGGT